MRRPANAGAFNGTVVVEWNNVTAGRDLDIDWFQSYEHFIRSGYAWVGVTPQRVGVEALKVWNAKRYGTLDVTHGGAVQNDALSYDVFAQAAQAIRTPGRVNVLGGLKPARIFATGHSQSAGRLANYVNGVHPIAPVFDAVVVHGGGGRIRTDLTITVFKLLAETDVARPAGGEPAAGHAASSARWEVAGNSHVDVQFRASSSKLAARDGSPSAPPLPGCRRRKTSRGRANAPNTPTTGRGVTTDAGLASGERRRLRAAAVQPRAVPSRDERGVRSPGAMGEGRQAAAVGAADRDDGRRAAGRRRARQVAAMRWAASASPSTPCRPPSTPA